MRLRSVDDVWEKFAKRGHMTQRDIARAAGISLHSVNRVFTHNEPVGRKVMFKIANAIDASMMDLVMQD